MSNLSRRIASTLRCLHWWRCLPALSGAVVASAGDDCTALAAAFLRVSGVTAREVQWLLIGEALLLGAAAVHSAWHWARHWHVESATAWRRSGSGFFRARSRSRISAPSVAAFFALGLTASIAGSCCLRVTPPHVTRARDEGRCERKTRKNRRPCMAGIAMLASAALLVGLPPVNGIPIFGTPQLRRC